MTRTQRGMRLEGHGLKDDGKSCHCGETFKDQRGFSEHCAAVQRMKEQPMDIAHTEHRAWT